jgi:hypothetical protein
MRQIYLYSLAVATARHSILVHLVMLMSTHEHLVLTDINGQLPAFLQIFHRLVGLGTKALRKWEGPVWDHEKTSVVELLTPSAVVEKIAYGIANPVSAGLVRRAQDWPGVKVRVDELGNAVWCIERPSFFFDPENESWPDQIELHISLPPAASAFGSTENFRELVRREVERLSAEARLEVQNRGWTFLGVDRCTKLSPFRRAHSREPIRSLNPTFAVGRGQTRNRKAAVTRLRQFRNEYRAALDSWRMGNRNVFFPQGTWLMRALHAAEIKTPLVLATASADATRIGVSHLTGERSTSAMI